MPESLARAAASLSSWLDSLLVFLANDIYWQGQVGPTQRLEAANILSSHAREDVLGIWIYPGPWQSWSQ